MVCPPGPCVVADSGVFFQQALQVVLDRPPSLFNEDARGDGDIEKFIEVWGKF